MTITFDEDLLTADDETTLSLTIEAGLLARQALEGQGRPPGASDDELATLQDRGAAAYTRLVAANLRLVTLVTSPVARRSGLDADELLQEGVLGLLEAARRFDHTRGTRFATFALPWIRMRVAEQAMTRFGGVGLRAGRARRWVRLRATQGTLQARLGRLPTIDELAAAVGFPAGQVRELLEYSPPQSLGDPELVAARAAMVQPEEEVDELALARMLRVLPADERAILVRLYGLPPHPMQSYEEVGAELSMSESTVRRRERAALARLRALAGREDLAA